VLYNGSGATSVDSSGNLTFDSYLEVGASAGSGVDAKFYTAGTAANVGLHWDADANTEGTLYGGVDDYGVDLKFFGETSGKYVEWDMSADKLTVSGILETTDLVLNNTKTQGNDVDGTKGNWTIQEGADDLFIINHQTGKKFKFKLEEIQ
jgi:hypothetical protein